MTEDLRILHKLYGVGIGSHIPYKDDPAITTALIDQAIDDIKSTIRNLPGQDRSNDPANIKALFWAIDHLGSTEYAANDGMNLMSASSSAFFMQNKCNIFVADAYILGAKVLPTFMVSHKSMKVLTRTFPPSANQIANPNYSMPNFRKGIGTPIGDIVAFSEEDGEGHATLRVGGELLIYASNWGVKLGTFAANIKGHAGWIDRHYYSP